MKTVFKIFCYLWCCIMLVACHPIPPTPSVQQKLPQQASNQQLLSKLRTLGLHYHYTQGHLVVLIPVSNFFQKNTVHLKADAQVKMEQAANILHDYLQHHPQHMARLVGFPVVQAQSSGLVLPHQYAVVIAGYLWGQKLPMRITHNLSEHADVLWVKKSLPQTHSKLGVVIELS